MKRIIIFAFLLLVLLFIGAEGKNIIKIEPSFSYEKINETILINITIFPSQPIAGAQCNIIFNSSLLFAKEVKNGNLFEFWANDLVENFTIINNENGSITNIVAFSSSPLNESGIFATILFKTRAEGIAKINISDAIISDENGNATQIEIFNGSIIIDAHPPTINLIDKPNISINYSNVHFKWNAIDNFSPPENITFSYKLEGYESWYEWSSSNEANYSNLTTGSYTFMIRAKDDAGNIGWLNYSFGILNRPPMSPILISPANGSTNISLNPKLSVFVIDPDGDAMDVTFYDGYGNVIGTIYNVKNGSYANITWHHLKGHTIYEWYAITSDGVYENKSEMWHFTTKNQAPIANEKQVYVNEDIAIAITLTAMDADNDTLSYSIYTLPTHGTLSGIPPKVTYLPFENYYGNDSFKFKVEDGYGGFDIATVNITIYPMPDSPTKPSLEASSTIAYVGNSIKFYVESEDGDGDKIRYGFDWNNDDIIDEWTDWFNSGEKATKDKIWYSAGNYNVRAIAEDENGMRSKWSNIVTVDIIQYTPPSENHPPVKPFDPNPSDGAKNVDLNITLSWECFDPDGDSLTYDVYLGMEEMSKIAANISSKSYKISLQPGRTYYWRIVAWDEHKKSSSSNIWHFTTIIINHPPSKPVIKSPINGSMDAPISPELSVIVYDEDNDLLTVTFYDAITNLSIGSVDVASGNVASIKWDGLEHGKEYAWYVVVSDGNATNRSDIFYFTTVKLHGSKYNIFLFFIPLIAIAVAIPSYFYLRKRKRKVVAVEEERKCTICLGKFKEEAKIVRCSCGALFHKSCATRVKECPNCGRKIG